MSTILLWSPGEMQAHGSFLLPGTVLGQCCHSRCHDMGHTGTSSGTLQEWAGAYGTISSITIFIFMYRISPKGRFSYSIVALLTSVIILFKIQQKFLYLPLLNLYSAML